MVFNEFYRRFHSFAETKGFRFRNNQFYCISGASLVVLKVFDGQYENQDYGYFMLNDQMEQRFSHVYIVRLIVTEGESETAQNIVGLSKNFSHNESMSDIFWWLRLDTGELISGPSQPNDICGLRRLLKRCADGENPSESMPVISDSFPLMTYLLIAVNVLIFALIELNGGENIDTLLRFGALEPDYILHQHQYYRLFTSMFLHAGILHIASNSLSLYIFGTRLEKCLPRYLYLILYLCSGIFGSVSSLIFEYTIGVGASGAILGLSGALIVYTLLTGRMVDGLTYYTMLIFIIISVCIGFTTPNVSNAAHVGGLVTGILIMAAYFGLRRLFGTGRRIRDNKGDQA